MMCLICMKSPFALLALTAAFLFSGLPALGHEFWIEPREFQVESGAPLVASLRNGQNFKGTDIAWFDNRIARAEWRQGAAGEAFTGRSGDRPALTLVPPGPGLVQMVYVSRAERLTYSEWEIFESFVTSKGFPSLTTRHRARALSETGFEEIYTRYCKSLAAAGGDATGVDTITGMHAELVALGNPYLDDPADGLAVEIRFDGAPRPGAQLDIFARDEKGNVTLSHVTAGPDGRATVPLSPGTDYLLDSVMIEEIERDGAVWESHWASLTFTVP